MTDLNLKEWNYVNVNKSQQKPKLAILTTENMSLQFFSVAKQQ